MSRQDRLSLIRARWHRQPAMVALTVANIALLSAGETMATGSYLLSPHERAQLARECPPKAKPLPVAPVEEPLPADYQPVAVEPYVPILDPVTDAEVRDEAFHAARFELDCMAYPLMLTA